LCWTSVVCVHCRYICVFVVVTKHLGGCQKVKHVCVKFT
jgi:hypothetical protein